MTNAKIEKILENAGFTGGESKVYLSLLNLGESKVGPIIKSAIISRSKVYDILERLIAKGVCSKAEKNNVLYYQALQPKTLLNLIKAKKEQLRSQEDILKKVLPQLISIQPKQKISVMVYEGFEGFKAVIDTIIRELGKNDTYYAWGISKTTESMGNYARKIYEAQRIKKFKAKSIFDELGVYKMAGRETPWHEMRVLPKGMRTPAGFTVYKNTAGIYFGEENTILIIVIKNKEIAKSFLSSFEVMWKIARPV